MGTYAGNHKGRQQVDAPCDGCSHERRCAVEQLACEAFNAWLSGLCPLDCKRVPGRRWWARIEMAVDEE